MPRVWGRHSSSSIQVVARCRDSIVSRTLLNFLLFYNRIRLKLTCRLLLDRFKLRAMHNSRCLNNPSSLKCLALDSCRQQKFWPSLEPYSHRWHHKTIICLLESIRLLSQKTKDQFLQIADLKLKTQMEL